MTNYGLSDYDRINNPDLYAEDRWGLINKEPYQPPDTSDSLLALSALTLYAIALVVLILVLFSGCSNPVAPEPPKKKHTAFHCGLTVQRSCQDCHVLQIEPLERNEV